jgi:hypothetical protein
MRKHALSREVARKRIPCKLYAISVNSTPTSVHHARRKRTKAITPKAEMGKSAHEGRQGLGRVRFLARLDTIREAVGKGYPLRMIYEEQQRNGLEISYSQFARYVNQFVHAAGDVTATRRNKGPGGERAGDQADRAKRPVGAPSGFRYRPAQGDGDDEIV